MRLENIIAAYRHVPFAPKRVLYRRLVNWMETKRRVDANEKLAQINLSQDKSFNINVDINTWLGKEIFYFGKFELFTYRFFLENIKSGAVFVDAGANIGFYSLMASVLSGAKGRAHCFEPTTKFYAELETNIMLNNFENLTLNKKALGHRSCQVSIKVGDQSASISADGQGESVEQITLDDYFQDMEQGPDFIKIDVDGNEHEILAGASKIIAKSKPFICVEISRLQNDGDEIYEFLNDSGYRLFHENNPSNQMTVGEFQNQLEILNSFNLIAIPHDRDFQLW